MNKTSLLLLGLTLPFATMAAENRDWEQLDRRLQHLEQQQTTQLQNTELSLRSSNNTVLLQTELKVLSRKPMRRRIASPWSIF